MFHAKSIKYWREIGQIKISIGIDHVLRVIYSVVSLLSTRNYSNIRL